MGHYQNATKTRSRGVRAPLRSKIISEKPVTNFLSLIFLPILLVILVRLVAKDLLGNVT